MACAAASSSGTRSVDGAAAGAGGGIGQDVRAQRAGARRAGGRRRASWENALDRLRALCLALAWPALAAGCGRTRAERSGEPIEMLVANDAETLDPRYAADLVGLRATRLVHAGLVRLDPDTLAPAPVPREVLALARPPLAGDRAPRRRALPLGCAPPARRRRRDAARLRVAPRRLPSRERRLGHRGGTRRGGARRRRAPRAASRDAPHRPRAAHPAAKTRRNRPRRRTGRSMAWARTGSRTSRAATSCSLPPTAVRSRARRTRSSFAQCTTRTRGRCVSRQAVPTSP